VGLAAGAEVVLAAVVVDAPAAVGVPVVAADATTIKDMHASHASRAGSTSYRSIERFYLRQN
jgi:hypothetical protein